MNPVTITLKDTEGKTRIINWMHFVEAQRGTETHKGSGEYKDATIILTRGDFRVADETFLSINKAIDKVTSTV